MQLHRDAGERLQHAVVEVARQPDLFLRCDSFTKPRQQVKVLQRGGHQACGDLSQLDVIQREPRLSRHNRLPSMPWPLINQAEARCALKRSTSKGGRGPWCHRRREAAHPVAWLADAIAFLTVGGGRGSRPPERLKHARRFTTPNESPSVPHSNVRRWLAGLFPDQHQARRAQNAGAAARTSLNTACCSPAAIGDHPARMLSRDAHADLVPPNNPRGSRYKSCTRLARRIAAGRTPARALPR